MDFKKQIAAEAAVSVPPSQRKRVEDMREGTAMCVKMAEKYRHPWERKVANGLSRMMGHMADAIDLNREKDGFQAAYQIQKAMCHARGYGMVRFMKLEKLPRVDTLSCGR